MVGTVFAPASGLWQDAALGLRIMALAEELAMLDVRGGRYVRVLDRGGKVQHGIVDQEAFARSTMPYPGPRLAQLPLTGFAATDRAGTLACLVPPPALLSSASFLQVHCIDRIVVERSRRDQLGLGFRPAPDNKTAAVEGVLWLDRATVAPRSVEWEYRDPTGEVPRGARGLVAFGIGRDSLPQAVRWWVRVPGVFQTTAGGAGEQVTNVIESGAFVLGSNDRPVEDPDGVFAALGEVFSIDPILVAGERAQRLTTEAGTKHIPAEELLGAPSTDAWDIVRILRPNWIRRSESIGLSDASSAGGLSFVVYLDRMRLSCLMGDARPQGMRTMSLLYGQSVPGRSGEQCLSPQAALASVSAADVASIEYVPPIEAGAIYGMGHGYGVVVVHTRRK
ncbi:MAG: hypothetical protein FIB01_09125 [Gemmatimonadetes bacterium]|nr:hypothetical protein [Gemmatimonadota bacterium]